MRDVVVVSLDEERGQPHPKCAAECPGQEEGHLGRGGVVVDVAAGGGDSVDADAGRGAGQGGVGANWGKNIPGYTVAEVWNDFGSFSGLEGTLHKEILAGRVIWLPTSLHHLQLCQVPMDFFS